MSSGRRWSRSQLAWLAAAVQFLALIRILSEIFRIKQFEPARYTLAAIEPFVGTALFTSCCLAVSVGLCAIGRPRGAMFVAAFNIVALLVYRIVFM